MLNKVVFILDWQQQEEDSNSKYCVFIAVSISKLQNSTWGDLVPSSTKRPPLKRLVTGEKRLRMALKNWACPGWGRPRTRARASRAVVARFLMVITGLSSWTESLVDWLAGWTHQPLLCRVSPRVCSLPNIWEPSPVLSSRDQTPGRDLQPGPRHYRTTSED